MSERQYERIARYLDGRDVALKGDERAVAEDIHRTEALVGAGLDVTLPTHALQRAMRKGRVAALHRSRRTLRFTLAAAGAAAAIVLLTISLLFKTPPTANMLYPLAQETDESRPVADVPMSDMIDSLKAVTAFDLELDQLTEEFEREEFGIASTPDIVGDIDEKSDAQQENLRPFQNDDLWNVPEKIESTDPLEAY